MVSTRKDGAHFRQNVLSCLTKLSHIPTPFITTFILIHLTAPVMANLGGTSLSSQTMLLGREYYQTGFGEKFLVVGPLVVHAVAGIAKRLLSPSKTRQRPLRTLLSFTGYAASLFFLPIHFMTHRVHPTTINAPISAVGPAELDYEFVKFGLQKWPLTSWFLYAGLLCSVSLHMAEGIALLWTTYLMDNGVQRLGMVGKGWKSVSRRTNVLVGLVLPTIGGLYAISSEPPMIFLSTARRFEAVFNSTWIYHL